MATIESPLYLTVFLYLVPGQEEAFAQYEDHALGLVVEHGGQVVCRIRPGGGAFLPPSQEQPYKIHVLEFPSAQTFDKFMQDPSRLAQAHLRQQAIQQTVIITGRINN